VVKHDFAGVFACIELTMDGSFIASSSFDDTVPNIAECVAQDGVRWIYGLVSERCSSVKLVAPCDVAQEVELLRSSAIPRLVVGRTEFFGPLKLEMFDDKANRLGVVAIGALRVSGLDVG
jgi:hypothetical protein